MINITAYFDKFGIIESFFIRNDHQRYRIVALFERLLQIGIGIIDKTASAVKQKSLFRLFALFGRLNFQNYGEGRPVTRELKQSLAKAATAKIGRHRQMFNKSA